MSYQAYLDAIEAKTGKTPQQLLDEAERRGYGRQTKAAVVVDWLKEEYGVGRGHAMAFYGVLKNGPTVPRSMWALPAVIATSRSPCGWME
jgi:Domain of unknown function (DUF4287)